MRVFLGTLWGICHSERQPSWTFSWMFLCAFGEFPSLVVSNLVVCNFYAEFVFAPFCAVLRTCACAFLRLFACFLRLTLQRPRLGTSEHCRERFREKTRGSRARVLRAAPSTSYVIIIGLTWGCAWEHQHQHEEENVNKGNKLQHPL